MFETGKERVFVEVARALRKKVYVTTAKLRILECLGFKDEDMQWFTTNEHESHIHVVPMWSIASFKRLNHMSKHYMVNASYKSFILFLNLFISAFSRYMNTFFDLVGSIQSDCYIFSYRMVIWKRKEVHWQKVAEGHHYKVKNTQNSTRRKDVCSRFTTTMTLFVQVRSTVQRAQQLHRAEGVC